MGKKTQKDGVQKVIDDNPELQWWFAEVEKAVKRLTEAAKKCESLTGIDKQLVSFLGLKQYTVKL